MRLWSLDPKYLDSKGLVALWREALLAQKVLQGKTKGYKKHPQLDRFKAHISPVAALATYLEGVCKEASKRGYQFDASKISRQRTSKKIPVTDGQLTYEYKWLSKKLKGRDPEKLREIKKLKPLKAHPFFKIRSGSVEPWEKVSP